MTFTFGSSRRNRIEGDIRSIKGAIADRERTREGFQQLLDNRRECDEIFKLLKPTVSLSGQEALTRIKDQYNLSTLSVRSALREIADVTCGIVGLKGDLRSSQRSLARTAEAESGNFTQEAADAIVAKNANIEKMVVNGFSIQCHFVNLRCTPRYNQVKFINNGGPVSFNIPDSVVTLTSNEFKPIMGIPGHSYQEDLPMHYERARTIHPHVLEFTDPCLGSFSDSLRDAARAQDFETYFTVCQMFLETADPDDSAGMLWWAGVVPEDTAYRWVEDDDENYYVLRSNFTRAFGKEHFEGQYFTVEDGEVTTHDWVEPEAAPAPTPVAPVPHLIIHSSAGNVLRTDTIGYVTDVLHPEFCEVEWVDVDDTRVGEATISADVVTMYRYGDLPRRVPPRLTTETPVPPAPPAPARSCSCCW